MSQFRKNPFVSMEDNDEEEDEDLSISGGVDGSEGEAVDKHGGATHTDEELFGGFNDRFEDEEFDMEKTKKREAKYVRMVEAYREERKDIYSKGGYEEETNDNGETTKRFIPPPPEYTDDAWEEELNARPDPFQVFNVHQERYDIDEKNGSHSNGTSQPSQNGLKSVTPKTQASINKEEEEEEEDISWMSKGARGFKELSKVPIEQRGYHLESSEEIDQQLNSKPSTEKKVVKEKRKSKAVVRTQKKQQKIEYDKSVSEQIKEFYESGERDYLLEKIAQNNSGAVIKIVSDSETSTTIVDEPNGKKLKLTDVRSVNKDTDPWKWASDIYILYTKTCTHSEFSEILNVLEDMKHSEKVFFKNDVEEQLKGLNCVHLAEGFIKPLVARRTTTTPAKPVAPPVEKCYTLRTVSGFMRLVNIYEKRAKAASLPNQSNAATVWIWVNYLVTTDKRASLLMNVKK